MELFGVFAVTEVVALFYLVGAVITAVVTFALSYRWRDARQPAARTVPFSVLAGVLWPLAVVGAVQLGAVALLMAAARQRRDDADDFALVQ